MSSRNYEPIFDGSRIIITARALRLDVLVVGNMAPKLFLILEVETAA